jgi:hypothetical protein
MSTLSRSPIATRTTTSARTAGLLLTAGGALNFAGGAMHPKEDPPDAALKEHLVAMYRDPLWFPSHAVFLAGMVLIAAALVLLVRRGVLRDVRPAHRAAMLAAVTGTVCAAASLLHLLSGLDAHRIEHGHATPLTDVQVLVESVSAPAFGLSIALLAVIGAVTRTLGNRIVAVFGVIGGVAYALAAGTILITDALDPLFPLAGGFAVWALVAGAGLLRPVSGSHGGRGGRVGRLGG